MPWHNLFGFVEEKRRFKELKEALLKDLSDNPDGDNKKNNAEGFQKPHSKGDHHKKAFRSSDETPSYTGGVSDEAKKRLEYRQNRDRDRKLHNSSKVSLKFKVYLLTKL